MLGSHNKLKRIPTNSMHLLCRMLCEPHILLGLVLLAVPKFVTQITISHYFDYKFITAICTASPVIVSTLTRPLLLYLRGEQKCQSINLPIEQLHATDENPFVGRKNFGT